MRVVVIGINYPPEVAGIAPQTAALCSHLAARGNDVYMLTARPHYPAWRVYCGYRGRGFVRETLEGVRVLRLPSYIPTRPGALVHRLLYDASFAAGRRPDSPPWPARRRVSLRRRPTRGQPWPPPSLHASSAGPGSRKSPTWPSTPGLPWE